jgi:adenylylsulfate kinase
MAGLPATGKSTLAQLLAHELDGVILDKDTVRQALFAPADIEYAVEQDDFCVGLMTQVAGYLLRRDPSRVVLIDGRPFARRYQVEQWRELGAELGTPVPVVECVCSEQSVRRRLERALAGGTHPAANRTLAMYQAMRSSFEPIVAPKVVIDTDGAPEDCLREALAFVASQD